MARTVDKMLLEMVIENKKAIKNLNAVQKRSNKIDKESQGFFKKMKLGWLAVAAGIGFAIRGIGNLISKASEAEETFSKFQTVFKDVAAEAESMATNLSKNFGLSSLKAKQLLGDTGDLLTGFGFTGKAALKLSTEVNELAVDLASFTNFSGGAEGASAALTKALLGERESVKSLGIAILESDVKAKIKALEVAGKFTTETEREKKAIATLQIAVEQSGNAIGDFQRTQTSWANQSRVLKARIEDLQVSVGGFFKDALKPLLPIMIKIVGKFQAWLDLNERATAIIKKQKEETQTVNDVLEKHGAVTDKQKQAVRDLSRAYEQWVSLQKDLRDFGLDPNNKLLKELGETMRINKEILQELNIDGKTANEIMMEGTQTIVDRTEAERLLEEERVLAAEAEAERVEAEKIRIEELEEKKRETEEAEKQRQNDKKKLIKDILKFEIDSEKSLTKLTNKELKQRLKDHTAVEKARKELSDTFVQGFIGGIESMKSSSKDVLKSMAQQFINFIVGKLLASAAMNIASGINAPIGFAQLAAAGAVKAIGGSIVSEISAAAEGMDSAPGGAVLVGERGPEIVNLPAGSQVIPNHKINMARFNTIPAMANGGIVGGDTVNNSGRNIIIQQLMLAPETPADFGEQLMDFAESINTDIINP